MPQNLVIVESPAKAKTIEKFLGKDYKVMSSYGHIRDLLKKDFSIDVEHGFAPIYEIPDDKRALVSQLKTAAAKAPVQAGVAFPVARRNWAPAPYSLTAAAGNVSGV